jgi:competence protein ComEC
VAVAQLADVLGWLAAPKLAVWSAPAPAPWVMLLAVFGTAWMLAPRAWPQRWAGWAAWIPLLAQLPSTPAPGRFAVTAFDVGQGMALLVETHSHRLLYDTGPQYAPGASGATRVILPYLRGRGISRLDTMVVSHSDLDHAGGAPAMLAALPIADVVSSLPDGHPVARTAARHTRCQAKQRWEWDGVAFEMLGPDPATYADKTLKANARSCVLRIAARGRAILLAADIEAAQEAALLRVAPEKLRADVLLAPHHGSGTSSTAAFLQAVGPSLGIFQVGYRNRYRHPKAQVYARYAELGIERLRTDQTGAVALDFGATIQRSEFRSERPRYWHGR